MTRMLASRRRDLDEEEPHEPAERRGNAATDLIAEEARWRRETFAPDAARAERQRNFVTDCGLEVKPLYTPADLDAIGFDYAADLGFPGEFPFTRGDRGAMNRGEPFVVSAYSGFGEAERCNQRFRTLIDWGAEQILVALDLPTQCGYDSDHAMVTAEEFGITQANVEEMKKSENPDIKRFLGEEADSTIGADLGLTKDWAVQVIKAVGNYGESFERNVGAGSPLKIERGLNALWSKGGLQYAPPIR